MGIRRNPQKYKTKNYKTTEKKTKALRNMNLQQGQTPSGTGSSDILPAYVY